MVGKFDKEQILKLSRYSGGREAKKAGEAGGKCIGSGGEEYCTKPLHIRKSEV